MGRTKTLGCIVSTLLISGGCGDKGALTVGSKNFTESVLLGEIAAQQIERKLHTKVVRRLNLGGTLLAHQSLVNGEIDVYPEYTGTAWSAILKEPDASADPAAVLARVRSEYERRFKIDWLDPLGINNTFAMVIRGDDARQHSLETLSDAAKAGRAWNLGAGYEFQQRADGLAALNRVYRLRWQGPPKSMDLGLLYQAIGQNQVDMIAANATDGLLSKLDLKILDDDKHAFPPYEVCLAVRQDCLAKTPSLRSALQELSGKLNNQSMRELNYQVDGLHRPVAQVAASFLDQLH